MRTVRPTDPTRPVRVVSSEPTQTRPDRWRGPLAASAVPLVAVLSYAGAWLLLRAGAPDRALACVVAGLVLSLGLVAVLLLRRRLAVVTVLGASMEPAYHDGDRVLVRRTAAFTPGQVVVAESPRAGRGWPQPPLGRTAGGGAVAGRTWIIKRVTAVPGDPVPRERVPALARVPGATVPPGKLVLLGDNAEASIDSRQLGYFPAERVLGAVLRQLSTDPLPRREERRLT
ncbi:S26 family signal peptidase [Micromonospora sp. NPDC049559]|uniref:S26 family signal peptidase n=1 Tax=Micromonospora sp. NPDC049559 TaxID=3155923 RepID=UPI00341FC7B7